MCILPHVRSDMEKETLSTSCGRERMLPVIKEGGHGAGPEQTLMDQALDEKARKLESRT